MHDLFFVVWFILSNILPWLYKSCYSSGWIVWYTAVKRQPVVNFTILFLVISKHFQATCGTFDKDPFLIFNYYSVVITQPKFSSLFNSLERHLELKEIKCMETFSMSSSNVVHCKRLLKESCFVASLMFLSSLSFQHSLWKA